jgi:hypothetical protein
MSLTHVCPFIFIASYPQLIDTIGLNASDGQRMFFTNGNKILFDPLVYVASNWNSPQMKEFVDCIGRVDEERATKHYIRTGANLKLEHDSFDEWTYLANNPSRIKKILRKQSNNKKKVDYDVITLTKRNIAQDFVKKKGVKKTNIFDPVKFVKHYIDDSEFVNKNKKLSINNAPEYFVKNYVRSKQVRYEASFRYKLTVFFHNRAIDSAKQIPYNAARYIVQTKIF